MRVARGALAAVLAAAAVALAGCGGSDAPKVAPGTAVHKAAAELRKAPFTFDVRYARARAGSGEPGQVFASGSGRVDLASRSGRERFDLSKLLRGARARGPAPPELRVPLEIRWTDGGTVARSGARRITTGLLPRLATEPAALVRLMTGARGARHVGGDEVGGTEADRYTFSVTWAAPGALLAAAADGSTAAGRVGIDVWVSGEGKPLRVAYAAGLSEVRGQAGQTIFPPTTVTATYDLRPGP